MRIDKKATIAGLAIVLAATVVVAGCSKKEGGSASPSAGQNTSQGSSTPEPKKDISVSIYDRGNFPASEGTIDNNRWTKWINEVGPAKVTFIPIPRFESQQKMNVLFASASAPDLILEYDANIRNSWYQQKLLRPIDDLVAKSVDYKKLLDKYPVIKKLAIRDDGKMYDIAHYNGLATNHQLIIRTDWLKKLNLSMPKTTDELLQVAEAFANQDPDGNGKKDTFGYNLSFVGGLITSNMFGNADWIETNGQLVHNWDRTADMVTFMKKLYDDGVVDKDFVADKNGQKALQDFTAGKLGIIGLNGGMKGNILDALKKSVPTATVDVLPLPTSKYGQFSPAIATPIQLIGVVNAKTKNPDAVMKYIDFMNQDATYNMLTYGPDGVYYKKDASGCPAPIDAAKITTEVTSNGDYRMLTNPGFDKCRGLSVNSSDPATIQEVLDITKKANEYYLSPDRPLPGVIPSDFFPQLPDDLNQLMKNMEKSVGSNGTNFAGFVSNALSDVWAKAVISGSAYTTEQAKKDAQEIWAKNGGQKIDDYYAKWWADNKAKAFLIKDLYTFK